MNREVIRAWNGFICGYVYTDSNGNKKATNEKGRIVGFYKKNMDITTTETGRIVGRGDMVVSLIPIRTK